LRDYDPTLPGVPCYPGELAQAFTHVITNAIEAMRGGSANGRTLTLRTRLAESIIVEIGDSGDGKRASPPHDQRQSSVGKPAAKRSTTVSTQSMLSGNPKS
jgi:hypothetical protein